MSDDRSDEIVQAVYRALCAHGYADLTMQDIADESSLSKGALHYHYDTKRDLLLAFLDHLYERFTGRLGEAIVAGEDDDPAVRLLALVDAVLGPPEDAEREEFRTAMLEVKAQAPYDEGFRERLAEFDAFVHGHVRDVVADGVARERFRESADPDEVASFVVTVINGARTRNVAVGHPIEEDRRALVDYVHGQLVSGDGEVAIR